MMFPNVVAILAHVNAGKVRALATSGPQRSRALPDLPTVVEAGLPGYVVTSWFGLVAPARTAPESIAKLNAALTTALRERETLEKIAAEGAEPAPGRPDEFGKLLFDRDVDVGQSDQSRRARLVAARGKSKGAVSMPKQRIDPSLEMYYELDDFTDPWHEPETILLLHGNAESSAMWYRVGAGAGSAFRVVRPDMRGFGASTPMPRDYAWSLDGVVNDFAKLMDESGHPALSSRRREDRRHRLQTFRRAVSAARSDAHAGRRPRTAQGTQTGRARQLAQADGGEGRGSVGAQHDGGALGQSFPA